MNDDDFMRGYCGDKTIHVPHQVMEYTGADDTFNVWCMGVTRGELKMLTRTRLD